MTTKFRQAEGRDGTRERQENGPPPGRLGRWFALTIFLILAASLVGLGWFFRAPTEQALPQNLAEGAQAYVRFRKTALSDSLSTLLSRPDLDIVDSQPHPLLGEVTPDFTLPGVSGPPIRLSEALDKGPVVLVFYYGYWCDHCVAQLFALNEDIDYFRELGATVIAVSADPTSLTRTRFEEYGAFRFPVASDQDNRVAQTYGVFEPASGATDEKLYHGTFIIARDGKIEWVDTGDQPFVHNETLLYELAKVEERLPEEVDQSASPTH